MSSTFISPKELSRILPSTKIRGAWFPVREVDPRNRIVAPLPGKPKAKVYARVIKAPQHAKSFLLALQDNIKKYEAQHGEIKLQGIDNKSKNIGLLSIPCSLISPCCRELTINRKI